MSAVPVDLADQLELLVADINGIPRGKTIETKTIRPGSKQRMALAHFFQTITGDYGAAVDEQNPKDEDMLLEPDWDTYRPTPWKGEDCAQVICRALTKQGRALRYDPRNALIHILSKYEARGWRPIVAPEVEFFLLQPVRDADLPLEPAKGQQGRVESGGESFSVDALDNFSAFVDTLDRYSLESGIQYSSLSHEMAPGQMEINVHHGEVLSRTDELFLLKRMIKACALRHRMIASFMAKPLEDQAGSGLHLHVSMLDASGTNIFALEHGKAGDRLRHFIGGLQRYLPQAFALIAPTVNSFKRFVPDLSAPVNLEWGYDNRTTGLRVPFDSDDHGRVENRISGADANPYLFIATTLACGLLGLEQELEPRHPVEDSAYNRSSTFPVDLNAALDRLERCEPIVTLFGKDLIDTFVLIKHAELQHFFSEISPWERRFLADSL